MIAATVTDDEVHLPTNVDSTEVAESLPEEYQSHDPRRPLLYTDPFDGKVYKYALKPLFYSAIFILLVELLERFTYYGIANTETAFLMGDYDAIWNANMTAVQASSFVSGTTAIAYSMPFLGGIIADGFFGDYFTIVFGTAIFYIPGILLLALTAIPYLFGPTFSQSALTAGVLVLYPAGAGFIKSVVNVFGAKQFHPILQTDMIQSYYVNFYLCINIGALVGGILIPVVAQSNVIAAYMIPVGALVLGLIVFLLGTRRYVRVAPRKDALFKSLTVLGKAAICKPFKTSKKSHGGTMDDTFVDGIKLLLAVIPISALTVPFNIAYSQMITVFIVQGLVMESAGFVDASMMLNWDSVSVLVFGFLVGTFLYPVLAKRGIHIAITHKFAIGTLFGAFAILASVIIDYAIHSSSAPLSIFWQVFMYMFIGAGEIFAVAAAYEATYVIAPKEQKGLASAFNLFLIGAVPNFISISLYNACASWFPTDDGLAAYKESQVYNYLWVLFGISIFGVFLNVFPPIKNWVERIHQYAAEVNAIEDTTTKPQKAMDSESSDDGDDQEKQLALKDADENKSEDELDDDYNASDEQDDEHPEESK